MRLLELAQKASQLFVKQPAAEKRRVLGFVLSNCTWKDGRLTAEYRQPFDLLAKNVIALKAKKPAEHAQTGLSESGSPTRTRTRDKLINSQSLYQLSYRGIVLL